MAQYEPIFCKHCGEVIGWITAKDEQVLNAICEACKGENIE